ncbi:hypothetical protein J3F83DRAFT_748933 [Trichoderma novae-zelandiae]
MQAHSAPKETCHCQRGSHTTHVAQVHACYIALPLFISRRHHLTPIRRRPKIPSPSTIPSRLSKMGKRDKQTPISLVFSPSTFIGPAFAASSVTLLQTNSISHVLSVGASHPSKVPGVEYTRVSIADSPSSTISKICDNACDIVEAALQSNNGSGRILVHCSAGISPSPTLVADEAS